VTAPARNPPPRPGRSESGMLFEIAGERID
jgi:hypothetical protein